MMLNPKNNLSLESHNTNRQPIRKLKKKKVIAFEPEIWKTAPPPFNRYKVSNTGKVRVIKTGRLVLPYVKQNGYCYIHVTTVFGKQMCIRAHRIIARVWIPNPENKPEVNHIDGDPTNNTVSNLEWVTSRENRKDAVRRKKINKKLEDDKKWVGDLFQ